MTVLAAADTVGLTPAVSHLTVLIALTLPVAGYVVWRELAHRRRRVVGRRLDRLNADGRPRPAEEPAWQFAARLARDVHTWWYGPDGRPPSQPIRPTPRRSRRR